MLASGHDGDGDALRINADARVAGATVKAGESVEYELNGRKGYLVPATGRIEVNGIAANARDGVAIAELDTITVTALEDSELVLVETA